jgi:hypothetical protein
VQAPDPHDPRGVRYGFVPVLAVAVRATLAGARWQAAIAERACDAPPALRAVPGLPGPVRRDESPRIRPAEPCLVDGRVLTGAMTRLGKAANLRRDPRQVPHSVATGPDSGEARTQVPRNCRRA